MQRQFRFVVTTMALVALGVACSPKMASGASLSAEMAKKPAYARAVKTLFDQTPDLPSWTVDVRKGKGGGWGSHTEIEGTSYEIFYVCVAPQKCSDNMMVLMFAPDGTRAWAGLRREGVPSYLGAPGDAQRAVLEEALRPVVVAPVAAPRPYMSEFLKKPAYARALKSLFDHAGNVPSWTLEVLKKKGAYKQGIAESTVADGTTYDVFFVCTQEFRCDDTLMYIMFAPDGTQAWALLSHEGVISYLGAPSAAQQAALQAVKARPRS